MKNAEHVIQLLMIAAAILVVSWLAVTGNEPAQGAMIGVVSAGVSYAFRGRVETPK